MDKLKADFIAFKQQVHGLKENELIKWDAAKRGKSLSEKIGDLGRNVQELDITEEEKAENKELIELINRIHKETLPWTGKLKKGSEIKSFLKEIEADLSIEKKLEEPQLAAKDAGKEADKGLLAAGVITSGVGLGIGGAGVAAVATGVEIGAVAAAVGVSTAAATVAVIAAPVITIGVGLVLLINYAMHRGEHQGHKPEGRIK